MLRDMALIFLALRVLVFVYFIALSVGKPPTKQALLIVPSVIYLLFSMYHYLYPGKLKLFKNYGDIIFVPALAIFSGQKEGFFALLPFISLYSSRRVFYGMLFLWFTVGFSFYHYGKLGLSLLPFLIALYISSLHPDLVDALRKERFYVRNLRKAYSKITADYSKLEKEMVILRAQAELLDTLQESQSLEDYLKAIKERFSLKAISITPLYEHSSKEIDFSNGGFHVPIRLEKGEARVSFYVNNPMELYDQELLKNLEKASKFISLYIEGFEEGRKAKVIAV